MECANIPRWVTNFEPETLINWRWEKDQSAFDSYAPMVVYGDVSQSWSELGDGYHQRLTAYLQIMGRCQVLFRHGEFLRKIAVKSDK